MCETKTNMKVTMAPIGILENGMMKQLIISKNPTKPKNART